MVSSARAQNGGNSVNDWTRHRHIQEYLIDASFAKTAKRLKAESKAKNITLELKKEKTSLVTLCSSYISKLKKKKKKRKRSESTSNEDVVTKNGAKKSKKSKKSEKPKVEVNGKKSSKIKAKTKTKTDTSSKTKKEKKKKEKKEKEKKKEGSLLSESNCKTKSSTTDSDSEVNGSASLANDDAVDYNGVREPTQDYEKKPFSRVDEDKELSEIKDERLKDNTYAGTFGEEGWGAKASKILVKVRGKDFRHEKTKKKRGGYRGGAIDFDAVRSVKFED